MLRVYNTLTRTKELFKPLEAKKVKMYVCGVTVYDLCHLGHARAYLVFDMIRRWLEYSGYQVTYIQNFTDIDDKIIKRAAEEKSDCLTISERYIAEYFKDFDKLGVERATYYPKATEHMNDIVQLIQKLLEKQKAYVVEGSVYFRVGSFKNYGQLSGRNFNDNEAGARVAVDPHKEDPLDFVLWKPAKGEEPGWDSPWGLGRPGWHIECSAMSQQQLGDSFDIHGGGQDLIFPHHENEIAQSEGATSKPYVKYWLHNGFVTINQTKMSKSLGNVFTLRDLLNHHSPAALRLFVLSTHYRSPINFADNQLIEAAKGIKRLQQAISQTADDRSTDEQLKQFEEQFTAQLNDDFNSAAAIGTLFSLAAHIKHSGKGGKLLQKLASVLGLELAASEQPNDSEPELPAEIKALTEERTAARLAQNWAESDRLREELAKLGYQVTDQSDGKSSVTLISNL